MSSLDQIPEPLTFLRVARLLPIFRRKKRR